MSGACQSPQMIPIQSATTRNFCPLNSFIRKPRQAISSPNAKTALVVIPLRSPLITAMSMMTQTLIPFGNDCIEENDHVVIISVQSGISDLNEVLYK